MEPSQHRSRHCVLKREGTSYARSAPGFMQICIFLCQFTVNCLPCQGKKWHVWLQASHSPCACSARREGAPVNAVLGQACTAGWQFGLRAAGQWDGVGESSGWGIISSLHLPLCLLLGLVLARSRTEMFCIHLLASTSCPSPRMLKYLSCPAQRAWREEGRQADASHSPTLLLILPRHPPYQHFVPPSLVNWWEKPPRNPRRAGLCCCRKCPIKCEAGSPAAVLDTWKTFHKHFWMLWGFKWDLKKKV